jgi:ABC-type Fe3+ transport system substrate-binding protein
MTTIKDLVEYIATKEGGKSNVKIGDAREVVGIISDLVYEVSTEDDGENQLEDFIKKLKANGKRRAKRKK